MIQKLDQNVGLMRGRSIVGKGAAKVTEPRWRDDPETPPTHGGGKQQTLIEDLHTRSS